MSTAITQWIVELVDKITSPVAGVTDAANEAAAAVNGIGDAANDANEQIKKLSAMDLKATADSIRDLTGQFQELMQPGLDFEVQMKEVQAITQMTDDEMQNMGDSARQLAKDFGGDASASLESFGSIIARFGPDIAKDQEAMDSMGNSVLILSKSMKGDAVGAMDALTTAMLQFGVDISSPKNAASEMARMMNVMAAAGNEGTSEVSNTAEALKQTGVVAKQANVSFEETNAALQALARGGRLGSEAGVSLRNVLSKMAGEDIIPREAREKLQALGVDFGIVSNTALPFVDRLKELKKVQNDATLAIQIFGNENVAAANILLNNIDYQEQMTQAITGTNAAHNNAGVIMSSVSEQINRMTAWVNDLKISLGGVVGGITPYVAGLGTVAFTIANVMAAGAGISQLIGFFKTLTIVTHLQTAAQWLLNSAFWANPITWVVAGIAALIAGIVLCWNKFEGFRKVVLGVWEVVKGFGGILKDFVIDRIKGIISGIGAMGEALMKLFDGDFDGAWQSAKQGVKDISGVDAVSNAIDGLGSLKDAWSTGVQKGAESWAESQDKGTAKGGGIGPLQMFQMGGQPTATAGGTGAGLVPTGGKSGGAGGKGSGDGVKLGGNGGGTTGKSVVMNSVINITGFRGTDELANEVARKINDRLSDAMAVVG